MKLNFSSLLITVGFAIILFSCTDHRLGGDLSPARLRLKTVQSGTAITTYIYDNQNRLSTISKSDGSLSVLSYDDLGKQYTYYSEYLNASDQTKGLVTLYPYTLDGTTFSAKQYPILNSAPYKGVTIATFNYGFDANKHINEYYKSDGDDNAAARIGAGYTSSGENIATSTAFSGRTNSPGYLYGYDDKINPFFGLMDPTLDPAQRFSRNNVVKADLTGYPNNLMTYAYEYNPQGLPTKRTATSNNTVTTVLTYTYESY